MQQKESQLLFEICDTVGSFSQIPTVLVWCYCDRNQPSSLPSFLGLAESYRMEVQMIAAAITGEQTWLWT